MRTSGNAAKFSNPLQKQPHHPGVAHYLIHRYDNPVLAKKALVAAQTYAKIAPASAHANHMPSHIFTRVGSWDESISSNIKAKELATKDEMTPLAGEARDQRLHAMDYLVYAYLQSGRVKQANEVVAEMQSLKPIQGLTLIGDYALAAMPARYVIELGIWEQAAKLTVRGDGVPWLGVGHHLNSHRSRQRPEGGSRACCGSGEGPCGPPR